MQEACIQCKKSHPNPMRCARCHHVAYCSKACQATHWKNVHKAQCKLFAPSTDEQKTKMDTSRDCIGRLCEMKIFMAIARAFAHHHSLTNQSFFVCLIQLDPHSNKYRCTLSYKNIQTDTFQNLPGMINLRFMSYVGKTTGFVMGLDFDTCRIDYEDIGNAMNFDKYGSTITILTDLENYCAVCD